QQAELRRPSTHKAPGAPRKASRCADPMFRRPQSPMGTVNVQVAQSGQEHSYRGESFTSPCIDGLTAVVSVARKSAMAFGPAVKICDPLLRGPRFRNGSLGGQLIFESFQGQFFRQFSGKNRLLEKLGLR